METSLSIKRVSAALLSFMLLFCCTLLAAAPKAVLSGPSQARAGDVVTLNGMHFAAGDTFTVKTLLGKRSSQEPVLAAADGSFSYQLITATAGTYKLQVRDSRNRLIATSVVIVSPAGG
jgi:nitrous oxidase accessory protein NosD